MRRVVSLVVVAFSGVACMNSKPAAKDSTVSPSLKAAVESTTAAFHQALRTNDTTAFFSYVDNDVVMMPPGEQAIHGISALRTWYSGFLGQYKTSSLSLEDKEVQVGNGWATETGSYQWGLQPVAGGAEVVDRGHYMQIWKQQSNGEWKFYREIWNSTAPPA